VEPLPWWRIAIPPVALVALGVYAWLRPNTRANAALIGAGLMAGYGSLHDQVSVRLCPEYFTVLHNPIPGLTDPTLLGLAWGILASVGGGVAMGYAAGLAATVGPRPQLSARELVLPMLAVLGWVAVVTAITGLSVARHADMFDVRLDPFLATIVPPERHHGLLVVACYHLAAYASAIVGSVAMCVWVGTERGRRVSRRAADG
jgi:hypothetical protein